MNSHARILEFFLSTLRGLNSYNSVVSIILGGSSTKGELNFKKDIDLMICCKDNMEEKLLEEIKITSFNKKIKELLDIKIFDLSNVKKINSSKDSPFFYHFVRNSQLIEGDDLRALFKINDTILYQSLNKNIERLDEIQSIYYHYNQKELAEIILFETLKAITVIDELLSSKTTKKTPTSEERLQIIYGEAISDVKRKVKNARTWVTIYGGKGEKGNFGSEHVFIKMKKRVIPTNIKDSKFDSILNTTKLLGHQTLELLNY